MIAERHAHGAWSPRRIAAALAVAALAAVVGARLSHDRPAVRHTAAVPNRVALLDAPPPRVEPRPPDLPEPDPLPQELADAFGDDAVQETGPAMLDEQLGLESDAQAGFDAFGLRAKRGGRDIMLDARSGPVRDTAPAAAAFAARVADELERALRQRPELRTSDYTARLRIWVDGEGRIARCVLAGSSGQPEVDAQLRASIDSSTVCVGAPPAEFPNPIELVVRSRRSTATRR